MVHDIPARDEVITSANGETACSSTRGSWLQRTYMTDRNLS